MKDKQKDKIIRDVLKKQSFNVDTNEIWYNIKDNLPSKKKRRPPILWLLSLLIIPIFLFVNDQIMEQADEEGQGGHMTYRPVESKDINVEDPANSLDKVVEMPDEQLNQNLSHAPLDQSIASSSLDDKSSAGYLKKEAVKSEMEKMKSGGASISSPLLAIGSEESNDSDDSSNFEMRSSEDILNNSEYVGHRPLTYTAFLPMLSFQLENKEMHEIICDIDFISDSQQAGKTSSKSKLGFYVLGGTNLTRSYNKGIAASQEWIDLSNNHENGRLAFSYSGGIVHNFNPRWSIDFNVSVNQSVVSYNNTSEVSYDMELEGLETIEIDALGSKSFSNGEIKTRVMRQNDIRWHRKHVNFETGVSLLGTIYQHSRSKLQVNLGSHYNIYTQVSGYKYKDAAYIDIETFSEDEAAFYRSSLGLRPFLGLRLNYQWKNVTFLLDLHHKWNTNPINKQIQNYQIKHSQTGIQIGTLYYLNGNEKD